MGWTKRTTNYERVDLAPLFPQDGSWAVLNSTITRAGNVVTLALGARPLVAQQTHVLLAIPARMRPPTPIVGELMMPATGFVSSRLLLNSSSGEISAYGAQPSSSWCYLSKSWLVETAAGGV